MMDFIISCLGVLIFTGLTAYDTQKLRQFGENAPLEDGTAVRRGAILGALTLYLDFINLFLMAGTDCGSRIYTRTVGAAGLFYAHHPARPDILFVRGVPHGPAVHVAPATQAKKQYSPRLPVEHSLSDSLFWRENGVSGTPDGVSISSSTWLRPPKPNPSKASRPSAPRLDGDRAKAATHTASHQPNQWVVPLWMALNTFCRPLRVGARPAMR
jgi:Integral membrane protein, interacts with FtsH